MSEARLRGPAAPVPRHATLGEALADAARSDSGLTFCDAREQETFHPFREIRGRALRAAGALRERGVRKGDRVALILPTGLPFMDAFFGALLAGAVPVPLYPPVRLGRLEEYHLRTAGLLTAVRARLLVTDSRVGRLLGIVEERAQPELGVARDLEGGAPYEAAADPEDLALIQFSSGTTVEPKPVQLTHRNVLANVAAIDSFLPEDGPVPQCGVSWLPLYHDMGLIGCLLAAVVHPGPLALIPPEAFLARPALWLRAISRRRATVSVAPNFAFGLCVKRIRDPELEGVDLSSWKLALNGAEPVSPAVLRRFAERFARWGFDARALTPVYGLSEATLAVTFSPPGRAAHTLRVDASTSGRAVESPGGRELASVGRPLPGVEVRVVGPSGETLREDEVGAVLVRGPSVTPGYFGDDPRSAQALAGGWLRTGDLGFAHDGELYLCGRSKDVVILRGRNHAPQEFEDALEGLAGIRAGCAVAVGVARDDSEELFVLAEIDGAPDVEAVRARVVERTGIRPAEVRLLAPGTLPRTSSGKLRRQEALRQLLAGELRPPRRVTAAGLLGEAARSLLARARLRLRP